MFHGSPNNWQLTYLSYWEVFEVFPSLPTYYHGFS
jgi:hypothetical protein